MKSGKQRVYTQVPSIYSAICSSQAETEKRKIYSLFYSKNIIESIQARKLTVTVLRVSHAFAIVTALHTLMCLEYVAFEE